VLKKFFTPPKGGGRLDEVMVRVEMVLEDPEKKRGNSVQFQIRFRHAIDSGIGLSITADELRV
jgi:hypothetical protein